MICFYTEIWGMGDADDMADLPEGMHGLLEKWNGDL